APPAGPVAGIPAQILQGQPSGTLDESALDLAEVDERGQGVPDIVDDVDAAQGVGAVEAVDLDLGDGGAVGEVLEGLAAHPRQVPVQALGAIEARGRELDALEVRGVDQLL